MDLYLLVNEGEDALEGALSLRSCGALELWDPMDGSVRPWPAEVEGGRLNARLRIERRQLLVLCVDPARTPDTRAEVPPLPGEALMEIAGPWQAAGPDGKPCSAPCPGDWAREREWETFSGTLRFSTRFRLPAGCPDGPLFLDLGRVGDIAQVALGGRPIGARAWAPYVFELGPLARGGEHVLQVSVTNSMANAYEGLQMPSGLLGPVTVRRAR